jgi:hypothetical protein
MFKRLGAKAGLAALGATLFAASVFAAVGLCAYALVTALSTRVTAVEAALWSAALFVAPAAVVMIIQLVKTESKRAEADPPAVLEKVVESPLALVAPPALLALAGRKPLLALVIAGVAALAAKDFGARRFP